MPVDKFGPMPDEDYEPAKIDDHLPEELQAMPRDEAARIVKRMDAAIREGTNPLKVLSDIVGIVRGVVGR